MSSRLRTTLSFGLLALAWGCGSSGERTNRSAHKVPAEALTAAEEPALAATGNPGPPNPSAPTPPPVVVTADPSRLTPDRTEKVVVVGDSTSRNAN